MVKADDRTSLPRNAKDKLLDPAKSEGIGPDRDEAFPLAETTIHSWVHYMEAFGEIPTELSEYAELMKEGCARIGCTASPSTSTMSRYEPGSTSIPSSGVHCGTSRTPTGDPAGDGNSAAPAR
jgi:hypothetical protein